MCGLQISGLLGHSGLSRNAGDVISAACDLKDGHSETHLQPANQPLPLLPFLPLPPALHRGSEGTGRHRGSRPHAVAYRLQGGTLWVIFPNTGAVWTHSHFCEWIPVLRRIVCGIARCLSYLLWIPPVLFWSIIAIENVLLLILSLPMDWLSLTGSLGFVLCNNTLAAP